MTAEWGNRVLRKTECSGLEDLTWPCLQDSSPCLTSSEHLLLVKPTQWPLIQQTPTEKLQSAEPGIGDRQASAWKAQGLVVSDLPSGMVLISYLMASYAALPASPSPQLQEFPYGLFSNCLGTIFSHHHLSGPWETLRHICLFTFPTGPGTVLST